MSRAAASLVVPFALAGAALAGCATPGGGGPPASAVPIAEVVTALAGSAPSSVAPPLTVYPTPRRAEYGAFLLPLAGSRRVEVGSHDFLDVLEERELIEAWRTLPHEGYVLEVSHQHGRTQIVIAAGDEAGARWADEALAQLTITGPGGAMLVRDCLIVDGPAFPLRGSKRPRGWELAYRANFAWGASASDPEYAGREMLPFHAPGSPLDAGAAGVRRALTAFAPFQRLGAHRFAIKFDDVGFGLSPRSELAFGTYPRALVLYLRYVQQALCSVDSRAVLYYLPQTYWWDDPRLPSFAAAVRAAGGLPDGVGLVLTGPEIISSTIDAEGLRAACRQFGGGGPAATHPLIYDNLGREGDWGPLTGRDPALAGVADAVFGERGTPVHRLTRLDWAWNPVAYDAERSFERAVYELAGPHGATALAAACRAFRRGVAPTEIAAAIDDFESVDLRGFAGPMRRSELVHLLREDLHRIERRRTASP